IMAPGIGDESGAALGRVVTSPKARGGGLGHKLIGEAVKACEARWPTHSIWLGAQAHLQGFYGQHGFVAEGEGYLEDDIPHMGMRRVAA
ncbi:MAG: GNAT family N-acetyltransferase, partial [Aeromonas veronii]